MPRTIRLDRAAASAEAEAFCDAVQVAGRTALGDAGYTASGDKPAENAPPLSGNDFTASGEPKPIQGPTLTGADFTASGDSKPIEE